MLSQILPRVRLAAPARTTLAGAGVALLAAATVLTAGFAESVLLIRPESAVYASRDGLLGILVDPAVRATLVVGFTINALLWTTAARGPRTRDGRLAWAAVASFAVLWVVATFRSPVAGHATLGQLAVAAGLAAGALVAAVPRPFHASATWGALVAGCIVCAAGHVTWAFSPDFSYRGQPRLSGLWTGPNHAGVAFGALAVLGAAAAIHARRDGSSARWIAGMVLFLPALAGILRTYSRGAAAATAAALFLLGWIAFRRCATTAAPRRIPLLLPAAAALAAALASVALWTLQDSSWPPVRRALSWANPDDFSWVHRASLLGPSLDALRLNPWLGHGTGGFDQGVRGWTDPLHQSETAAATLNHWIVLAGEAGIPAGLALALALGLGLRSALLQPGRPLVGGCLVLFALAGTVDGTWFAAVGSPWWAALAASTVPLRPPQPPPG